MRYVSKSGLGEVFDLAIREERTFEQESGQTQVQIRLDDKSNLFGKVVSQQF
jgi:hypothetical protein